MSEIAQAITALGTILTGFAAVAAAVVAWTGLSTWKKEGFWRDDKELAKKALLAIYSFRETLFAVRHPAMSASEMDLDEEERKRIFAASERSAGVINAYAKRWDTHSKARASLDSVLLEADAMWGNELRDHLRALRKLEHELYVYISLHIDAHLRGNTELAVEYRKILKTKRDILYDLMDDEKDEFRKDFSEALHPVEAYLRAKLGSGCIDFRCAA